MSYIDIIKEKARADRKTIVLPETNDKRTLIAAAHILEEGIADIIMYIRVERFTGFGPMVSWTAPDGWKLT